LAKYNCNNKVKEYNMGRACSKHDEMKNECRILMENPEAKRPLGSYRRRWEGNVKTRIREI
jgi:hypothetical protein